MTNPHPFEDLFKQLTDLLANIQEKPEPTLTTEIKSDIEKQLGNLEQSIGFFQKVTQEAIIKSGLNEESIKKMVDNPESYFDRKNRKILDKAKKLKEDLEGFEKIVEKKKTTAKIQKRKAKTEGKNRKKKFKRLGGQGWMPL